MKPTGAREVPRPGIFNERAFAYFWSATTLRAVGGAVAGVAFPVLAVTVVGASDAEFGVLNALAVVPYLFIGLLVGAWMDRWRRQRSLVITTAARGITLAVVPVLLLTDTLTFWSLGAVMLTLGTLALFSDSAAQPLLPRLVPRGSLPAANARLAQSETVAATVGPALGGVLLKAIGAPLLFAIDAVINVIAALLQSRIRIADTPAATTDRRRIRDEILDGIRYTYRHRTLRPLAISVHIWFLGNSLVTTAFAMYALGALHLSPVGYGVALAAGGLGGFIGAVAAPSIGRRMGAGRAILCGRALIVVPWIGLAVIPLTSDSPVVLVTAVMATAQFLACLAMGIEDTNDISYRQGVAPDEIQGRMNATIRTVNRVTFFFGALAAGALMTFAGYRATMGVGAALFLVATLVIAFSAVRDVRHERSEA